MFGVVCDKKFLGQLALGIGGSLTTVITLTNSSCSYANLTVGGLLNKSSQVFTATRPAYRRFASLYASPAPPTAPTFDAATYAAAAPQRPASASCTVSSAKVLNVVKPPARPVPSSSRARGLSRPPAPNAASEPRNSEPVTLIEHVAHGGEGKRAEDESRQRSTAPTAAPEATHAASTAAISRISQRELELR